MTGKAYYLTTLGAWRRHAGRLANSHWLALNSDAGDGSKASGGDAGNSLTDNAPVVTAGTACRAPTDEVLDEPGDATRILALIEADEGAHLALRDDAEFEQLPHPLSQRPVSEAAVAALAAHGVASGANMFEAAEAVARVHPLLQHRVF
ncbi:MAG: hypothetical protein WCA15_22905 [Candidatus Acidiferrales bacterium]